MANNDMVNGSEIVVPLSALALAAGAIYRAGRLGGAVDAHATRLDRVEDAVSKGVSRTELDHRFSALEGKIDMVLSLLNTRSHSTD